MMENLGSFYISPIKKIAVMYISVYNSSLFKIILCVCEQNFIYIYEVYTYVSHTFSQLKDSK